MADRVRKAALNAPHSPDAARDFSWRSEMGRTIYGNFRSTSPACRKKLDFFPEVTKKSPGATLQKFEPEEELPVVIRVDWWFR